MHKLQVPLDVEGYIGEGKRKHFRVNMVKITVSSALN